MSDGGAAPASERSEQRYTELLLRAGEILSSALDWRETVAAVCDAIVESIADVCFLYMTDEAGELHLAAASSADPQVAETLAEAERFIHGPMRRTPLVREVIESGESVCIPLLDDERLKLIALSPAHERFMRRIGYRSIVVVPIVTKIRGSVGALAIVRTERSPEPFNEQSLRFIEDVARRCATAISKAVLFEQTQRIARVFQTAALPARLPAAEGIVFDSFYEPSSEELLVGGDWYDAFTLPDGRIAITIGDVLGHGLDAAVWMSRLRNGFRAALFGDPDPARALDIIDRMLRIDTQKEFFTTALVSLVDPIRQTLLCASAGHPGPLIWIGTGEVVDPFTERGLPLGMRELGPVSPTAQVLNVRVGSFAAFFTDGLLEFNRDIASSWAALTDALTSQKVREAEHPAKAIRDTVIADARHTDDVAILTVRWDAVKTAL
jgi:GAF domain-containing protein